MWRVILCLVFLLVRVAGLGSVAAPVTGAPRWETAQPATVAQSADIIPYIPAWRSVLNRILRRALRRGIAEALPRIRALRCKAGCLLGWSGYGCSALFSGLLGPAGRVWSWAFG